MAEFEERSMGRHACEQLDLRPAGGDLAPNRYGLGAQSMACLPPEVAEFFKAPAAPESACDKAYQDVERVTGLKQKLGISACDVGRMSAEALGAYGGWRAGMRVITTKDGEKIVLRSLDGLRGKKAPGSAAAGQAAVHADDKEIFDYLMPRLDANPDLRSVFMHAFTSPKPRSFVHRINGYFVTQEHFDSQVVYSVYKSDAQQFVGLRSLPGVATGRAPTLAEQVLAEVLAGK